MHARSRRARLVFLGLVAFALLAVGRVAASPDRAAAPTAAQRGALTSLPVLQPSLTCAQVTALDVSQAVGAGTAITSATPATAPQGYPYCDVRGTIAPQIQFALQLPTQTYQQRYLQTGCGGLCGVVNVSAPASAGCVPLANGAFAMASNNLGHVGSSGVFGIDPLLRVDFAYRADHLLALAAKAIVRSFYGQAPRYSYFDGCSTGGREGLEEVERFPADFDGVLAGAPASISNDLNSFYQPWLGTVDTDAQGNLILPASKLGLLHDAVIAGCDGRDGLVDGQIDDPRACTFDPHSLQCAGADAPTCLTPAQVAVVGKVYSGPVDARGRHLYPGGEPLGSELAWSPWLIPPTGAPQTQAGTISYSIGSSWLKYLAFPTNPPLSFTLADATFDQRTFERVQELAGLHDATDPDLSAFRRAGGKLILWHGWSDQAISPYGTLAYYQAIQDESGGLAATQGFARLFMFPGVLHCGGGAAPNTFDLLTQLLDWVESGIAPTKVVASQLSGTQVVRTRPVFPYPLVARYTGTGSIDDAANFAPAEPARRFDDHFSWLGSFKPGNLLWCDLKDGRFVCTKKAPR